MAPTPFVKQGFNPFSEVLQPWKDVVKNQKGREKKGRSFLFIS
jgi:hypothetical protein